MMLAILIHVAYATAITALTNILSITSLAIIFYYTYYHKNIPAHKLYNKTIVIIGGSSGIGKHLIPILLKNNINKVIVMARLSDPASVANLTHEFGEWSNKIMFVKVDVTNSQQTQEAFGQINKQLKIDWVIISAGIALPSLITHQIDMLNTNESKQLDLNYYGSLNVVKSILKLEIKVERIVFIGSLVSVASFCGYSGYGASKYALKGLVDTLRNELVDVRIQMYLPCSVDTPGYEIENKMKPTVTKMMEDTIEPMKPNLAAEIMIKGILSEYYMFTNDFVAYLLLLMSCGLSPRFCCVLECLSLPLIGLMSHLTAKKFDKLATNKQND